jgi:hypothetical protein
MPKYMRVKYTTATLEKMAEVGAAVWNLASEFMQTVAVPKEVVLREWCEAWADGAEHVDLEVQSVLLDKSDSFDVTKDIPTFRRLVIEHILAAPVKRSSVEMDTIEVDNFNLVMKKADYDVTVYQIWEKNVQTHTLLWTMLVVIFAWHSGPGMLMPLNCSCTSTPSC